jgi:hypothetical protein
MTAAVLDRPGSLFADAACRAEHPVAGRPASLQELLDSTLHRAEANGSTECPVCHASMTRTTSARAHEQRGVGGGAGQALAAICGGCGSRLS